jgi:hypothetical protein
VAEKIMPGRADYLVELRGFEPLTSAVEARGGAPPLPRFNIAQGAPLDPVLDGCCFPCPTRGQYIERLAGLDQDCGFLFHILADRIGLRGGAPPIARC